MTEMRVAQPLREQSSQIRLKWLLRSAPDLHIILRLQFRISALSGFRAYRVLVLGFGVRTFGFPHF